MIHTISIAAFIHSSMRYELVSRHQIFPINGEYLSSVNNWQSAIDFGRRRITRVGLREGTRVRERYLIVPDSNSEVLILIVGLNISHSFIDGGKEMRKVVDVIQQGREKGPFSVCRACPLRPDLTLSRPDLTLSRPDLTLSRPDLP